MPEPRAKKSVHGTREVQTEAGNCGFWRFGGLGFVVVFLFGMGMGFSVFGVSGLGLSGILS